MKTELVVRLLDVKEAQCDLSGRQHREVVFFQVNGGAIQHIAKNRFFETFKMLKACLPQSMTPESPASPA